MPSMHASMTCREGKHERRFVPDGWTVNDWLRPTTRDACILAAAPTAVRWRSCHESHPTRTAVRGARLALCATIARR